MGDDWSRSSLASCSTSRSTRDADRLSLTTVTRGRREPTARRSCAARPTSRRASACRSRCRAPSCPATGTSSAPRSWAWPARACSARATSCGLTADADGILILPADTPLGVPLVDICRRRGPGRRRQAQPRRRAVHHRPRARGRRSHRRPRALAGHRGRRSRAMRRPPTAWPSRSDDRQLCPRFVGSLGRRRDRRAVALRVQLRLLAAGMRPISNVVDASQLRDARAGQAHPHLRRGGRQPRRPTIIVRRARRPASGSRRSTTSSATLDRRDPAHRRPVRAPRHRRASWAAPTSEVSDGTTAVDRRVGHLRPGEHPPDGAPLRAPLGGQPAVREGPGVPARAPRRRPDGPAARAVGRRRVAPGRVDTAIPTSPARRASRSARHASTGSSARSSAATSSARSSSGSGSRPSGRRAATCRSPSPTGPSRCACEPRPARPSSPSCRPGAATSLIEADIAEEVARVRGYELVPSVTARHADAPVPPFAARSCATSSVRRSPAPA